MKLTKVKKLPKGVYSNLMYNKYELLDEIYKNFPLANICSYQYPYLVGSSCKYKTIQALLNDLTTTENITIFIYDGLYKEHLTLPNNVSLIGVGSNVILQGSLGVTSGNHTIKNMHFRTSEVSTNFSNSYWNTPACLHVDDGDISIQDCTFTGYGGGIRIYSGMVTIKDCSFECGDFCIWSLGLYGSPQPIVSVSSSTLSSTTSGTTNWALSYSRSQIYLDSCRLNSINGGEISTINLHNTFIDNGFPINNRIGGESIMHSGLFIHPSSDAYLDSNHITKILPI